jgi:zinc protease
MIDEGTTRRNPDYYSIEVFNESFGGGFGSRLFSNIRSIQGLAYSVGGGIGTGWDHPALSRFGADTKSQSTLESIQALYHEIENLKTHPIDDEEIRRAKDSILNSFIFNFDTPEKVLREKMAYEFFGYPLDFLEKYEAGIQKVTTADVAKIPPKYLHPPQMRVLVVGNAAEFDKPLKSLGPVTPIDITIPPPPGQGNSGAKPPQ